MCTNYHFVFVFSYTYIQEPLFRDLWSAADDNTHSCLSCLSYRTTHWIIRLPLLNSQSDFRPHARYFMSFSDPYFRPFIVSPSLSCCLNKSNVTLYLVFDILIWLIWGRGFYLKVWTFSDQDYCSPVVELRLFYVEI